MAETARYDIAAKRYAEAVFDLARSSNSYDRWRDDLAIITELARHPEAAAFLANGQVSDADKLRLVQAALRDVTPEAINLVRLLLLRGRFPLAPQVNGEYNRMLDRERGVQQAEVTTAVPLEPAAAQAVVDRLREITGAREIRLTTRVDPAIIGGMVARIGDQLVDGSTRTRLLQLKRRLAGAAG